MAIPTLTDIGNRIVQGVGTLTGQIRNPFDDMISQLEERLQATNNEDEIVKINDQLRTLRAASDEWSGYDVAKQDPTAAPEWMQTIHNAARVGGDNLDLVDVGTAFIPVGVATKGAALVGRGLGKAGRGLGALATKYVDSAAARAGEKAAEQAAEQAAKAISKSRSPKLLFKREGELTSAAAKRMLGTNNLINATINDAGKVGKALTKGRKFARQQLKEREARRAYTKAANAVANDLADNMVLRGMSSAGEGVSKFGTGFERGAEWLASHPIARDVAEQGVIEGAHGAASYNPEYGESMGLNALEQGGLAGLMQGGISALGGRRLRAIDALPQNEIARKAINDAGARGFSFAVPEYSPRVHAGERVAPDIGSLPTLEKSWADELNAPLTIKERDEAIKATERLLQEKPFVVHDIFKEGGASPMLGWSGYYPSTKYGEELRFFRSPYIDKPLRSLSDNIASGRVGGRIGINAPPPLTPYEQELKKQADKMFMSNITRSRGHGEWTPDMFDKADDNVRFLEGLSGLHYAPLPKGAISNRMADIYSAQTEPLTGFGTAGYRAAYNALLDALREGAEGGLDGLYGLGYVDE